MYMQIRFNFKVMDYFGKYKKSRKAVELIIIDDGLGLGLLNNYPLPEWFTYNYREIYQYSAEGRVETTGVVLCCLHDLPRALRLLWPLWTGLWLMMAESRSSIETWVYLSSFYLIVFVYFEYRIFGLLFTNSPSQGCEAFLLKGIPHLKIDFLLDLVLFLHNFFDYTGVPLPFWE